MNSIEVHQGAHGGDNRVLQVMSPNNPESNVVTSARTLTTSTPSVLQASSGDRETIAMQRDSTMSTGSPSKGQLKSEVEALSLIHI